MVAGRYATMRQGERTDLEPSANLQKVSTAEAARQLSVSERTAAAGRKVAQSTPSRSGVRAKKRRGELLAVLREVGLLRDGKRSSEDDSLSLDDLGVTRNESSEEPKSGPNVIFTVDLDGSGERH